MVGVPHSTGCRTCVQRRVKCDEARPACARCNAHGVNCPGYVKTFKFVDRAYRRSQPQCNNMWTSQQGCSTAVSSAPNLAAESSSSPETSIVQSSRSLLDRATATISSPSINQTQCLSRWIADVSKSHSSNPDEMAIPKLFYFLTARLGTSNALDMAIRCLTVHHLGITQDNEQAVRYSRFVYGKALSSLQKAIYNPAQATTSTTICATMVLCLYELFVCTKSDSWMKHAEGASKLIQLRGPQSFRDEFDCATLLAFKGLLIMEALFAGKHCFLDREEWRNLALQLPGDKISAQFYEKTEEFSKCLAVCPGLVKEAYALRSPDSIPEAAQVLSLLHRTIEVYDRLQQWFEGFIKFAPSPEEVMSSSRDSLYPVVYHYHNASIATVFCSYNATAIIFRKILMEFKYADYADEISQSVDNICKSVEYLSETGIMGPYRLGFSMRIAYEVSTITTKLWIRTWLVRLQKFYGSISLENYPPIEVPNN